jgi:hypothetical protein
MPYKHGDKAINMSTWIQWLNNRIKKFDMLGSIWFANMDCLVGNFRYLHDDGYEYQQPSEPYKSDKPNESKFGDKQIHQCSVYANRVCNCDDGTSCDDGYDDNDSDDPIVNIDRIYDTKRFFNDNIYQFDEFHNKLTGQERQCEGLSNTERERDSAWIRTCHEHATTELRIQSTTTTNSGIY